MLKKILSFLLCFSLIFSLCGCVSIGDLFRETNELLAEFADTFSDELENELYGFDEFTSEEDSDTSALESAEQSSEEEIQSSAPLLYKVTDNKGNVIWLFGSIHVGEDYFYPLPDYVLDAFEGADSLAVEFDIVAYEKNYKAQMQSLQSFVYTDGTKIYDHIPTELYNKAKEILKEQNVYNSYLDYYNTSMWSSFLDNALYEKIGADYKLGVDRYMINLAYEQDKEVLDIESAELQYSMLSGFSEELQLMMLESSVEMFENEVDAKMQLNGMMQVWASGDKEKLSQMMSSDLSTEGLTEDEAELYAEYNYEMITKRNNSMTDWAENALKSGEEVFICVGAAHIVGDGAVAQMLEERGYTVDIVD